MGALTDPRPSTRSQWDVRRPALVAIGVTFLAAGVVGVVGGLAWLVGAAAGSTLVAVGLVAGHGVPVTVGVVVQVVAGCGALVASAPDGGVRPVSLLVAVLVWLGFELACSSLERRPAPVATRAARTARAADLVVVAASGAAIGVLALALAGRGPVGDTVLRVGAMAIVVATLGVVWLLSRGRRSG